jgi:hypothetical protein
MRISLKKNNWIWLWFVRLEKSKSLIKLKSKTYLKKIIKIRLIIKYHKSKQSSRTFKS